MAHATSLLSSGISRRNPEDEYELIQKIGSGTYGDVYKVRKMSTKSVNHANIFFQCFRPKNYKQMNWLQLR